MDKVKLGTADLTQSNVEKIAALFPDAVTETVGEDGRVRRAIDFDALRDDLSSDVVEDRRERYQFTWPGKRAAKLEARTPCDKTLRPCREKSVDWDTTENIYIEGDNLEALKLLRETYAGKVKLIYIDPPYNTGHDFIYDDDFAQTRADYEAESGDFDEEGGRLVANPESNGRFHSDWCSMMYPRLLLARDLLTSDGAIFISIDDNESNNCERLCDEVFGRANFLTRFIWRKVDAPNDNHVVVTPDHEYVLAYCKDQQRAALCQREAPELVEAYNGPDERGRYWRDRLLRKNGKNSLRADRPTMYYPLTAPDGTEVWPMREDGREGRWAAGPSSVKALDDRGDLIWKQRDGSWVPYTREYAADNPTKPWMTIWNDLPAMRQTKAGMRELFGTSNVFDTPKPPELIERCMKLAGVKDRDIICDFFSGSASTAHAAMSLAADGGARTNWILVQISEPVSEGSDAEHLGLATLCEIGEERIRRAGKKILDDVNAKNAQPELFGDSSTTALRTSAQNDGEGPAGAASARNDGLDVGFRVLRIDSSNFEDTRVVPTEQNQGTLDVYIDNVKPGRSAEDLLFQVLPAFRIPLSASIETFEAAGATCFDVNSGQLVACFDTDVSTETIELIAQRKPLYAVLRDASLADDACASNFEELFRTYSPDTVRRVI